MPILKLETLAGLSDVRTIVQSSLPILKGPPLDVVTEGDADHRADVFRSLTGVAGENLAGLGRPIKIGILSDGLANDAIAGNKLQKSIASGNLAGTGIGPGKVFVVLDGPASIPATPTSPAIIGNTGEGVAMLEIVRDLVPNAQLYFASAGPTFSSTKADFANSIALLKAQGCDIIIDDVGYTDEAPFQNDVLAQATNTAVAGGALFFSAAGNDGNLTAGTASTWEGDFTNGGRINIGVNPVTQTAYGSIIVHRYSTGQPWNNVNIGTAETVLNWSDPIAKSSNDYDLFVTNATGTGIVDVSTTVQNGTGDAQEFVGIVSQTHLVNIPAGSRIYIAATPAASTRVPPLPPNPIPPAQRALRLNLLRGPGTTQAFTFVTNGSVYGHSAAGSAYSVSATPATVDNFSFPILFSAASRTEVFTVDGPRRLFYNDDGSLITNGAAPLFSTGAGNLLQKTDITAADGVTTSVNGFIPFFGTSAAAPHAGAIAGLLKSYRGMQSSTFINGSLLTTVDTTLPTTRERINPSEMYLTLTRSAIDIGATGFDNVAGNGIVMPLNALNFLTNFVTTTSVLNLGSTSATVRFNTNLPADATVQVISDTVYQASGSLASAVTFTNPTVSVIHNVNVTGLTPGVKYDYFISSKTPSGSVVYNEPAATLRTFTTTGVTPPPPPPASTSLTLSSATAVKSGTDIIVNANLFNGDNFIVQNVKITSGQLNGVNTKTVLPLMVISSLYPQATVSAPLRFAYPAGGKAGDTATLVIQGTTSSGTFNGTATVKLP